MFVEMLSLMFFRVVVSALHVVQNSRVLVCGFISCLRFRGTHVCCVLVFAHVFVCVCVVSLASL